MSVGWQFVIVIFFAGLVGLTEVTTRYRSNPGYVLSHSLAAWAYITLNALAGAGALALIRAFGWFASSSHPDLWRILIAGFGALAFFRSSLFVTKIGSTDVNVGPSVVLGALLDTCDRAVDRLSAEEISQAVSNDKMSGLDPTQVMFALPVLCLALMQNFPPGDQAQLGAELSKIRGDTSITPQAQMRAVVIQLSKYLGADLVGTVLQATRSILVAAPPSTSGTPDAQAVIEEARKQLTEQTAEKPPPKR